MTNFATILKQLTPPVDLAGLDAFDAVEGAALDGVQESAGQLLQEILPDLAWLTLADWERVLGITTNPALTLVERRRNALVKFYGRELNKDFFIRLAALMGQAITITDYVRPRAGRAVCGDLLSVSAAKWTWWVKGLVDTDEFARCGEFSAGERLGGSSANIETIFNALKPAHTLVYFEYNG